MNGLIEDHKIKATPIPSVGMPSITTIGTSEFRDAVTCLYGIVNLSPRIAHRIMRKIIGVYRHLAAISQGSLNDC